jgi:hypothetical protein
MTKMNKTTPKKKKRSKMAAVHHSDFAPREPLVTATTMTEAREMIEMILWQCLWRPAPLDILALQKTLGCTPA